MIFIEKTGKDKWKNLKTDSAPEMKMRPLFV